MNFITTDDLEFALNNILLFLKTSNKHYLEVAQPEIKKARDFDLQVKTQADYEKNEFVAESHGLGRMAMFLLNSKGEHYINGGILTIYEDDPKKSPNSHTNIYKIELKDKNTHDRIWDTNPTADDKPYDFNAVFQQQFTVYPDKAVETTEHAWESFTHFYKDADGNLQTIKVGYHTPYRTLDFKSAYWKDGHKHSVDYITTIDVTGQMFVIRDQKSIKETKRFDFVPTAENVKYLQQYLEWIAKFEKLQFYISWEYFIIN